MPSVSVSTVIFGSSDKGSALPAVELKLVSERVSAGEIISRTVKEQLDELIRQRLDQQTIHQRFKQQYLHPEDIDRQIANGKIALARPDESATPDLDREVKRVLDAFEKQSFKMFVDGHEISHANEICTLTEGTRIKFLRLIPLVGG